MSSVVIEHNILMSTTWDINTNRFWSISNPRLQSLQSVQEQKPPTESLDSTVWLSLTFYHRGITVGVAPHPHGNPVRRDPVPRGITVNVVPITAVSPRLPRYYRRPLHGLSAFQLHETVENWPSYELFEQPSYETNDIFQSKTHKTKNRKWMHRMLLLTCNTSICIYNCKSQLNVTEINYNLNAHCNNTSIELTKQMIPTSKLCSRTTSQQHLFICT